MVKEKRDIVADYKEVKSRYDFDFAGAESYGYLPDEIIKHVRKNAPEKNSYRIGRGVSNIAGKAWDTTKEGVGAGLKKAVSRPGEIWDTVVDESKRRQERGMIEGIRNTPREIYNTTPGAIAVNSLGKAVNRIAPSLDESLVSRGDISDKIVKKVSDVSPGTGGFVDRGVDTAVGLVTPKNIGIMGATVAAAPVVAPIVSAIYGPDLAFGSYESSVDAIVNAVHGKWPEFGGDVWDAVSQAAMVGGMVKHGKAKYKKNLETAKVNKRVNIENEAARMAEKVKGKTQKQIQDAQAKHAQGKKVRLEVEEQRLQEKVRNRLSNDFEKANKAVKWAEKVESRNPDGVVAGKPSLQRTVRGTPGIAETMEMPRTGQRKVIYREGKPLEVVNDGGRRGRSPVEEIMMGDKDVADLVKRKILSEKGNMLPKERPTYNDTPFQKIVDDMDGLSIAADKGFGGELARMQEMGARNIRKGEGRHKKTGDFRRTGDELRRRAVEEGLLPEDATISDAIEAWENEKFRKSQGKRVPTNDAAISQYEVKQRGLPDDWKARLEGESTLNLVDELFGKRRGSFSNEPLTLNERMRRRAVQRELAKRGGKTAGDVIENVGTVAASKKPIPAPEVSPMDVSKTVIPKTIEQPSIAKTVAPKLSDVVTDKPVVKEYSNAELKKQNKADIKARWGTSRIDRTRGFEELGSKQKGELGKIHKQTFDKVYEAQKGYAKDITNEPAIINKSLKDIGIKISKENSRLVRHHGEKTMTYDQIVKKVGKVNADKIVAADKVFRNTYDRFIEETNVARVARGEAPIKPEKNFYRHMGEPSGIVQGMRDALGRDTTQTYGTGEQSIYKKRTANLPTDVGAMEGFLNYLPQHAWEKNMTPLKHTMVSALDNVVRKTGHNEKVLPNTKSFYKDLIRDLSREKTSLDAHVENVISDVAGQTGLNTYVNVKKVGSTVIKNTVSSAKPLLTNFAAYTGAAGKLSTVDWVKGQLRTFRELGKKTKTMEKGAFGPERYYDYEASKTGAKGIGVLGKLFNINDRSLVTRPIYNALVEQGKRLGKTNPLKYADREIGKIVGARSTIDRPAFYNSSVGRQAAPFTLEINNFRKLLMDVGRDLFKGKKGGGASRASSALSLAKMAVASNLFNDITEEVFGYRVVFDPYDAAVRSMEADNPVQAFGILFSEVLSLHPLSGLATQLPSKQFRQKYMGKEEPGRFGVVQAKPFKAAKKLIDAGYNKFVTGKPVTQDVFKAVTDIAGALTPWGPGAQMRNTAQGLKVLYDDGKIRYGSKRGRVDTSDIWEVLKLVAGGPSSTSAMRKLVEKTTK